ncbi:MAG: FHA domain-containing protein [Tepidiformaceae bacterium]
MSSSIELLTLRLGLIALIFGFVLITALTMRSGLRLTTVLQSSAGRARPSSPRLILLVPGETHLDPGTEFPVAGTMSLGRDPGNGIVLGDPSVSGVHASFERLRDGWRLTDLGSTNGTTMNGRLVDGRGVVLRGGERLSLGTVVMRFQA